MGLQTIYVFECYGNYTIHEFTATVLSYLTPILWAKGHLHQLLRLIFFLFLIFHEWLVLIRPELTFHNFDVFIFSTETLISSSLNIQWKHTIHNHSTCCFASETLVSDQSVNKSCPQHYVTRMKLRNKLVPVSWPFFDENWAVFSAKITTKFSFWRT